MDFENGRTGAIPPGAALRPRQSAYATLPCGRDSNACWHRSPGKFARGLGGVPPRKYRPCVAIFVADRSRSARTCLAAVSARVRAAKPGIHCQSGIARSRDNGSVMVPDRRRQDRGLPAVDRFRDLLATTSCDWRTSWCRGDHLHALYPPPADDSAIRARCRPDLRL